MTWAYRLRGIASPDAAVVDAVSELEPEGQPLSIGRDPGPGGIPIDDKRLSRRHCSFSITERGSIIVTDHDSTNGTMVNRAQVDGTMTVWSDAVIRVGNTVLHVGWGVHGEGDMRWRIDPLIRMHARALASGDEPVGILAGRGAGIRTLVREIHRRSNRGGSLLLLTPDAWKHSDPEASLPADSDSSVLFMGVEQALPDVMARTRDTARQSGVRFFASSALGWDGLSGLVGQDACIELPPIESRRAAVWGVTRAWLKHLLDDDAPEFSRGAAMVWLCAPLSAGWRELEGRVKRLAEVVAGEPEIRSRDIRRVIEPPRPRTTAPPVRRSMRRPTKEELVAVLDELPTIQAVADHFGRNRRQIYRWMKALDLQRQKGDTKTE